MPDDSGDGLTPATAKRTIRAARDAYTSGGAILVRAGQCHDPLNGHFLSGPMPGDAGLYVDTYGDGDRPIWDNLVYQNPGTSGWTHVSGGVWRKSFGAWYTRRVFSGSRNNGVLVTDRIVGPALGRALVGGATTPAQNPTEQQIVAALSPSRPWAPGGVDVGWALYMLTGSATVQPPDYFGGLALLHADGVQFGAFAPVLLRDIRNVWIRGQHFRGAGGAAVRVDCGNADARDTGRIVIEDCTVTHLHQSAIRAQRQAEASPTRMIRDVSVRRVLVDYCTNAGEQETTDTETALSGVGDGFVADIGSHGVVFDRCEVVNAFHAGVAIGATVANVAHPTSCAAVECKIRFDKWATYSRGVAVYNGSGHKVDGCAITGQNVRSQIAGGVTVSGSRWLDCGVSTRKPGVSQWLACESYWWDSGSSLGDAVRYVPVWPVDVRISDNFADVRSTDGEAVQLNSFASSAPVGSAMWGAVSVTNNVVLSGAPLLSVSEGGGNAASIPMPTASGNRVSTDARPVACLPI